MIRTRDIQLPKLALHQTELRPDAAEVPDLLPRVDLPHAAEPAQMRPVAAEPSRDIPEGDPRYGHEASLAELAVQIAAAHELTANSLRTTVEHAVTTGRLLIEAKRRLAHGEWEVWLKQHVSTLSVRTAQRYMRACTKVVKNDTMAFSTIGKLIGEQRTEAPSPWWENETTDRLLDTWTKWPDQFDPVLHYLSADGFDEDEIAERLGVSSEQVARWLGDPPRIKAVRGEDIPLVDPCQAAADWYWFGRGPRAAQQLAIIYKREDLARRLDIKARTHDRLQRQAWQSLRGIGPRLSLFMLIGMQRCRELLSGIEAEGSPTIELYIAAARWMRGARAHGDEEFPFLQDGSWLDTYFAAAQVAGTSLNQHLAAVLTADILYSEGSDYLSVRGLGRLA